MCVCVPAELLVAIIARELFTSSVDCRRELDFASQEISRRPHDIHVFIRSAEISIYFLQQASVYGNLIRYLNLFDHKHQQRLNVYSIDRVLQTSD